MSAARKRLFLIDGSAVFYRAYFAFIRNPLINSKGEDTSATYGFVNSILKLLREEDPEYVAMVFDTREPTFRHKMYSEYKSTRARMPDELVAQLPRIHQSVAALNMPAYSLAGYEADDIIGTLATKAARDGIDVWCMTGDKDFFQLVDERISIYYPARTAAAKAKMMGREEVLEKFGVYPESVIDKLALMGDSSDNVPGIPGVGPKTADKLLAQFGSLDEILARYEEISAKGLREKIAKGRESALLSRELVTIRRDVEIDYSIDDMKRRPIDYAATKELFLDLEFTRLLGQLVPNEQSAEPSGQSAPKVKIDYRTVSSILELKELVKELNGCREVAVDTETTSLNTLDAELVGISLSARAGTGWYIPLGHTVDTDRNLPLKEALQVLKPLFLNKKVQKFGQNIKYDLEVFRNYEIDITPVAFDTMLASYVLDPATRGHSLSALAIKHFDYQMQPITDLIGVGKKQKSFATVDIDRASFYAAEDADYTYRLRGILAPQIDQYEMHHLYYNIELPLVKVLTDVELAGVQVDRDYLARLSTDLETRIKDVSKQIFEIAGDEFNINSTKQLSHILFDKLSLPTKGKTAKKTGFSTDVRVLEELAELHPFPKLVLNYRQFSKLKSTYVDAIPRLINSRTGRVHTSFNQAVTATGRLSSTDPNLQNIPVRTEDGREIRRAFVARDSDHILLVADYSQIELRILAHYSDDPGLIDAFRKKEDIHTRTASEVYGVAPDKVTGEMRRAAKTANFAVVYGVSAFGLAQQTELDLDGAKQFIDTYFERYTGIKEYMDRTREAARRDGYVTTLFNRRRYLPEINSKNYNIRQFSERIAINTPIQGTAADMIKIAMIDIHRKLTAMRSEMILQVHDELIFDVHKEEVSEVTKIVRKGMEKAVKLKVPVVADIGVGENWLDAK